MSKTQTGLILKHNRTTITVGEGANLAVGGSFTADTGERRADGSLNADRMTVDGVVKGDSRQQVSVSRSGEGADANPESSPAPSYDNTRYATQTANGKTFSVPLAPCPTGGCANGDSIAWATTNQKDQQVLAAYKTELDQEAKRATALAAGTPVMASGVALGGIPGAGQIAMGAIIGAGVNYAAQMQLNDGKINESEVYMGAITGGLSMGRGLIPTVLINTGGSMNTSAYLNENIGASMAGTAIGSGLGWGTGNLVEKLTSKIIGASVKDTFWQTSKGYSSDMVEKPFGITAPVVATPVSPWPSRVGATVGAGVQEAAGDKVKNWLKEQP